MRTLFRNLFVSIFLLPAACSFSQPLATTGFSGTGDNIDVTHYVCNWNIDPNAASKTISGSVTICFFTRAASVSTIKFDLNKASFNNGSLSVMYHGSSIPFSFPASAPVNIITVTLPSALPINKFDSLTINYSGIPPGVVGAAEGYQRGTDPATSTKKYVMTLSESYEDRDWWPCKADMQDKADSMDFIVTVPWNTATNDTFWVATNGKLINSPIVGNQRIFTFQTRYPIASYLVCVSVARFKRFYNTVNVNGTNVPVEYDLLVGRTAAAYSSIVASMDKINQVLVAFSNKFGDYPFKNEKHGFYDGLLGAGGMEHQTFSAIAPGSLQDMGTLSHELMHQWFGDKVSFATWNDLWLAEGFARYSEPLAGELVSGLGLNPISLRGGYKTTATNTTNRAYGAWIPNASMTNSDGIWNTAYGTTVYERGAMIVSMLRKLAGDTRFFQALQNYLNDPALAYKSATTTNLKNHFEAVLGYDLDAFFTDFVSGGGYPNYTVKWGNNNKRFNVELSSQAQVSGGTTTYFHTPVVIRIANSTATVDTTIVIYDENGQVSYAGNGIQATRSGKVLGYNLSFVPATITFDPDNETLAIGTITADHARLDNISLVILDVKILSFTGSQVSDGNLLSLSIAPTPEQLKMILERSDDGIHFSTVGNMNNNTSTSNSINFSFLDKNVFDKPVYYYRVKSIDAKSAVTYSKTISIASRHEENFVKINPNPASNFIKITLPVTWQNKSFSYIIYNSNGIAVKKEGNKKPGNDFSIFVGNLSAGNYNIEIISAGERQVTKSFTVIHK